MEVTEQKRMVKEAITAVLEKVADIELSKR